MMRLIIACLASLLAAGCATKPSIPLITSTRYVEHLPYHEDGTAKPKIALLPVVDSSECFLPWDVEKEFNNTLRYQAMSTGDLFLIPENVVSTYMHGESAIDAFNSDLSFTSCFCDSDFIVALELIEHKLIPYERGKIYPPIEPQNYSWRSVLQMKMRLRVIDLRCGAPRIVLQEIFTSNYAIPLSCECIDYKDKCWGSKTFPTTPYGLAHKQLACNLMFRIYTAIEGM